jgi:hypothetical protein
MGLDQVLNLFKYFDTDSREIRRTLPLDATMANAMFAEFKVMVHANQML